MAHGATRGLVGRWAAVGGRHAGPSTGRYLGGVAMTSESTPEQQRPSEHRVWWTTKWVVPVFSVLLGLVEWVAFAVGGDARAGAIGFFITAAFGALLLLGGRSESIRGMRGDGRDERWAMIDLRATALAGFAVIVAVIVGFIVEVGRGRSGNPYVWLGALAGFTYLIALLIGRWRT